MDNRRMALQFPTSRLLCQALPLAAQLIRNQPNVLLKGGQKPGVTKHIRERWCWICEAQLQHMGKSWPDLLEIGIISSAALGAEQAGGPGAAAEERGRMPMQAWSKLNIRRQQVPLRLLGCSFGRGEKQAIKEAEYTRVNFICSTNCHARALIALTCSARDWALLESQAVGESSKVALVGSCSHHTFH